MVKIGCHLSITPSILNAINYAINIGANAGQIFLGNNQSSSIKSKQKITDDNILEIKKTIELYDFHLSIHAIYLLNFCAFPSNSKRITYAQNNLIYDLEIGDKIGAKCIVVHIGVMKNLSRLEAYNNMADNILYILKKTEKSCKNIKLLLETPAGQGTQIASKLEDLTELWNLILSHSNKYNLSKKYIISRLGFCIDTAHIFSSGYAIRMKKGMTEYLTRFNKLIGLDKVGLIHLNDSKADLNSHRDIHEGIGDGYIFNINKIKTSKYPIPIKKTDYLQNLVVLLKKTKSFKIPAIILETHKAGSPFTEGGELYSQEIGLLYSLLNDYNWIKNNNWKLKHLDKNYFIKSNKKVSRVKKSKKKNITNFNIMKNNFKPSSQIYPTNLIIIKKLKLIKEYYEKIDKDNIRKLAYSKAILALQNYPEEIIYANQLRNIKGIGDKMIKKIGEYLETGEMEIIKTRNIVQELNKYKENEKYKINNILGFGPTKTKELNNKKIYTYYDLIKEIKNDNIKLNDKEHLGVKYHLDLIKMIPRTESLKIFKKILKVIKNNNLDKKYNLNIELAGSYPSGKIESKDIDILIFSEKIKDKNELKSKGINIINDILDILKKNKIIIEVISKGYGMLMCLIKSDKYIRHLDIRLLPQNSEVFGRLYFTSGGDFNQIMRQRAKELGMLLNEFDLIDKNNGKSIFTNKKNITEKDIFNKLNLTYIPLIKRR
jgi:apurinic endonuclease APN1